MDKRFQVGFHVEMISKASYIESSPAYHDSRYLCTVWVIKLNYTALEEYWNGEVMNCRNCYNTSTEWEAYKAKKEKSRAEFDAKICEILGIKPSDENHSVCITQSLAEIFTVVQINTLTKEV